MIQWENDNKNNLVIQILLNELLVDEIIVNVSRGFFKMLSRIYVKSVFKSPMLDSSCAKVILQFLFKLMIDSHAILNLQRKRRHTYKIEQVTVLIK